MKGLYRIESEGQLVQKSFCNPKELFTFLQMPAIQNNQINNLHSIQHQAMFNNVLSKSLSHSIITLCRQLSHAENVKAPYEETKSIPIV